MTEEIAAEYGEPASSFRKHLEILRGADLLDIDAVRGRGIRLRLLNGYPYRGPMVRLKDTISLAVVKLKPPEAPGPPPAMPAEGQSQRPSTGSGNDRGWSERARLSTNSLTKKNKEHHPDQGPPVSAVIGASLRENSSPDIRDPRSEAMAQGSTREKSVALQAAIGAGFTSGLWPYLASCLRPWLDPRLGPTAIREAVRRLSESYDEAGKLPPDLAQHFYRFACAEQGVEPDPEFLRPLITGPGDESDARGGGPPGSDLERLREREPAIATSLEDCARSISGYPARALAQGIDELARKRLTEGRNWPVRNVGAYLRATVVRISKQAKSGMADGVIEGMQP